MQHKRTREEILGLPYLKTTDIRRLLCVSAQSAKKIYSLAEKIDIDQLGDYRIEDNKVRITSVCKVTGLTIAGLQKQIKSTAPRGNE